MMKIKVVASGSKANFHIIEGLKEIVLIECGVRKDVIIRELKGNFSRVVCCLLSHEHQDHAKSAKFISEQTDLICSNGTADSLKIKNFIPNKFESDEFKITSFKTNHDAREPIGFHIHNKIEKKNIVFITDSYFVQYYFKDIDLFLIECNYDNETANKNFNSEKLPLSQLNRLQRSHMELGDTVKFLEKSFNQNSKVKAIHVSDKNMNRKEMISKLSKFNYIIDDEFEI